MAKVNRSQLRRLREQVEMLPPALPFAHLSDAELDREVEATEQELLTLLAEAGEEYPAELLFLRRQIEEAMCAPVPDFVNGAMP
jgi:hypothetical protein